MAIAPILNNIRIIPRDDEFLNRKLGSRGEIFYDRNSNSLRLYDGNVTGGISLAKADLTNISNAAFLAKAIAAGVGSGGNNSESGASISVSPTAPQDAESGNLWFNSVNGYLSVYVDDESSEQWVQPGLPIANLAPVAFTGDYEDLVNVPEITEVDLTGYATETFVGTAISNLIDAAPTALNTLNELAAALNDDANFATTVTTALGNKAPINDPTFTGIVSGITATMVGLGNVTNESKATLFTSPTFTGTPNAPTAAAGISTTQLATTAFVNNATSNINASSISGTVALSQGGTGQTTIAGIKSVLGLASSKVAIGATSGVTSQGSGAVAVGNGTGNNNQGAYSVAIGYVAGTYYQGASSIAIGVNAAQSSQGANAVAIGDVAGQERQGANAVAIGSYAGQDRQGANAVAIGGYSTSSFANSIAIGYKATTTAANTIQLGGDGVVSGSTAITNVKTTGTLTAGTVTYPNAHNSTAGQLLSIDATGTAAWTTPASSGGGTHAIGEVYGGGIVFYVWDGGAHGLIGANTELNNGQATSWGGGSSAYVGTQNRYGVLGGKLNTQRILNVIPVPTFGNGDNGTGNKSAAYWAATYLSAAVVVAGVTVTPQFSDWYLPNETELMLFATQRSYFPNCNFTTHDHWSSSERPDYAYLAYALGANSNTNIYQDAKTATKYVLAIRSF
jgi:hypothetical protein